MNLFLQFVAMSRFCRDNPQFVWVMCKGIQVENLKNGQYLLHLLSLLVLDLASDGPSRFQAPLHYVTNPALLGAKSLLMQDRQFLFLSYLLAHFDLLKLLGVNFLP